ncbi:MAG: hypothetical protein OXI16_04170 [Chloroflexota bacterium]|nr:hypothetical protein [Chloroflexota bacterium]
MATRKQISMDSLEEVFSLAEELLKGDWNRTIAQSIVNEKGRVQYEKSLYKLYMSALTSIFPDCEIRPKHRIDICVTNAGRVVAAIECKGMVSNAAENDVFDNSLHVTGIRNKIWPNPWIKTTLTSDIEGIKDKIPYGAANPTLEIFIPCVYEIYRKGAKTYRELFDVKNKPWTTLPKFKKAGRTLYRDLEELFFQDEYPDEFTPIHATKPIELLSANQLWLERYRDEEPWTPISEAYVSFFVFGRYVEK